MKSFEEMTLEEKINWASGYLLISIGEGKFREAVCAIILSSIEEGNRHCKTTSQHCSSCGHKGINKGCNQCRDRAKALESKK